MSRRILAAGGATAMLIGLAFLFATRQVGDDAAFIDIAGAFMQAILGAIGGALIVVGMTFVGIAISAAVLARLTATER